MNRTRAVCYTNFGLYSFAMNPQEILWGLEPQSTLFVLKVHSKELSSLVGKCLFTGAESNIGCLGSHLPHPSPPKKLLFLQCAAWNWALHVPAVLPYICRLQLHCKMHSDPQLLLLRISFFSRAINSMRVEIFLWPDLDHLAYERSAVL